MQARGGALLPGIVFDSDMGRNIDAALALTMLYGLGRGRLIAVGISHSNLDAAAFCDVVARFYIGDAAARNTGNSGVLPFGLLEDGAKLDDPAMLTVPLGMRGADGQPAFRHGIRSLNDTADPAVAFRNALLTQQEKQGIAVMAGPATNMARLLALNGAKNIVATKLRLLVMAAGEFGGGAPDPRIVADIMAARRVLAEWPTPIVAVGVEAGNAAPFPDETIAVDFGLMSNHPIIPAYRAYREKHSLPKGAAPAQAVLAALYAANVDAAYLRLSPPGTIEIDDAGRTRFKESATGTHRYLIIDPAQKEAVTKAFIALATTKPATGRGAPPKD